MAHKSKIIYTADKDIDGVELMDAYYTQHHYTSHAHDEFAIGVMEEGIQDYTPEKSPSDYIYKGHIPVVNPGRVHAGKSVDDIGYKYRMFYIQPEILVNIATDIQLNNVATPHFDHFAIKDKQLGQQLLFLHHSLSAGEFDAIQKQNLFYESFAYLLKNHSGKAPREIKLSANSYAIRRTIDYLQTHYDQKIELSDLARISGLSTYYLNRIFSKSVGMPPHRYLINLRLNKARNLLKKNLPISEVTYETGFADQSHLTRNFKLFWGITPKQYQRSIR